MRFYVKELYISLGNIKIRSAGREIVLRSFQEDVVKAVKDENVVSVYAPTGSGKTLLLLAPLISNILFDTDFSGAVGLYPTRPLVNDQFLSITSFLDNLCVREASMKGSDGRDVVVRYRCSLDVEDLSINMRRHKDLSIGVVRMTSEILRKMSEALYNEEKPHISILDLVRKTVLDAEYLILFTVPEYPYMFLTGFFRDFDKLKDFLRGVSDYHSIFRLMREISEMSDEDLRFFLMKTRQRLIHLFQRKSLERTRLDIFSALFSDVMFLDEFHAWSFYDKPVLLALLIIYYLEHESRGRRWRIILSSATPDRDFVEKLKRLEIKVREVTAVTHERSENSQKIKSRMIIEILPSESFKSSGFIAWITSEDDLPKFVDELSDKIASCERAIIFSRRNSIVEESAKVFYERTGKIPVVVTGVRPPKDFLGREALEERRSFGELFVFGNFSVELGIDLRRIKCGIVHGATLGEIIQKIGRIGRGDVDEAWIGIVMPRIYVSFFKDLDEKTISYSEFVERLSQVVAQTLPVEKCGESFIWSSSIGRIRMYLPLTSFLLYQIALWEYHEDVKRLVKKMIEMLNRLGIDGRDLEPLRKADSPEILIPLAFMRRGDYVRYVRDDVEDEASMTTLLGNYDVEYENGRVVIKGVEKKSLHDLMRLTAVDASAGSLREKSGRITSSKQALRDIKLEGDETLLKILRNRDIPLYITKEENICMKILTAFGHAIEIESPFPDMTRGGKEKPTIAHLIIL
jgi:hypothetical protein